MKKQILNSLLAAFLSSTILVACSGSDSAGGSPGGNGGGGGTTGELSGLIDVDSVKYTVNDLGDGRIERIYEFKALGDDIVHREIRLKEDLRELEERQLTVNGVQLDESSFVSYGYLGTYSVDGISKSFAVTPPEPEPEDLGYDDFVAHADEEGNPLSSWSYEDVYYAYTSGRAGGKPVVVYDRDGTISYDGTNWSATLGDVRLQGSVNGTEVSGEAKLDDMAGEFEGYDGSYNGTADDDPYFRSKSWGTFAGDNGKDSSFAGKWDW